MKIKAMTLQWTDSGFDTEPLDAFCAENDILAVTDHFFTHQGHPAWTLLLTYRPTSGAPLSRPAIDTREDPRTQLDNEDKTLFEALRRWRNDRALREGKPAYVLFTNNQMIAVARARPRTKTALGAIHGIGQAKLDAYADEVLAIIANLPAGATSAPAGEPIHVG